jgi:hypothetical protein
MNRLAMFTAVLWLMAYASSSVACSCVRATLAERYKAADAVFIARVTAAELLSERDAHFEYLRARYELGEVFKGNPEKAGALRTHAGGSYGTCGVPLNVGDHLLLFVTKDFTSQCHGSHQYHQIRDREKVDELRRLKGATP